MAIKPTLTTLQASTIDILNTIRANASQEYQELVPEVSSLEPEQSIREVGTAILGYPTLANQFVNALVNRIAFTILSSATFYNMYKNLKKGVVELGETIEEIFVNIAELRDYNPEKAPQRELKRTLPDVKTAFHIMNFQGQYPVTIQNNELRQAFLSFDGVEKMISDIVQSVYTAAEYDEFLLFKYLLIKGVTKGAISFKEDGTTMEKKAVAFRGMSNNLLFMSNKYNQQNVRTNTPKDRQVIFMSADFNAQYDVEVLASAFNMDKSEFMGKLYLIDDFTTFDNERFAQLRQANDSIELVTDAELEEMKKVEAIILDEKWFQFYDNLNMFTEVYVSSGLYWNYNYTVWKTVSFSPFSNAVAFIEPQETEIVPNSTLSYKVASKDITDEVTTFTLEPDKEVGDTLPFNFVFVQTEEAVTNSIGVHKWGGIMIPKSATTGYTPELLYVPTGITYKATTAINSTTEVGDTIQFNAVSNS